MVLFPNAKINLGLSVTSKRSDGYHNLETVFYPVALKDVLEIIPSNEKQTAPVELSTSGLLIAGNGADNLCVKAYHLLQHDFHDLPPVKMHLHKVIPMGAGLGGGSSDGASALLLLNKIFELRLSTDQLIEYALKLGSDCPFFIINKPCLAVSRGEIMEPIPLDLSAYSFVLVDTNIHVNTGWAFTQLNRESDASISAPKALHEYMHEPIDTWNGRLVNDFEKPVFEKHPLLKLIKEQLYQQGAVYASMSGSGSIIFGIFEKNSVPAALEGMSDLKLITVTAGKW